jgi:hypothetical protein
VGRLLTAKQPSGKTEWETPPELITALLHDLGLDSFDLDAAAQKGNAKAAWYYGPDHENEEYRDGLTGRWWGNVWLNPPYGRGIGKWAIKARAEVEEGNAQLVAALLPVNTSTRWWHRQVMAATEIRLLERRVTFVGQPSGAPFDNVIVIWRRKQLGRKYQYLMGWDWLWRYENGEWIYLGESSRQKDTGSVPETPVQGRPASQ